jgi:hypothetical protein
MNRLSAVIIDTYPNKHLAAIAVHMALRLPNVGKIYTFSDQPFFDGAEFIKVPTLASNNDYGSIIFNEIPKYVTEEHFFIIQWDGFPLFPKNWSNEFLKYDYIGAPVLGWIGNGGFSLRSQKLLETIKSLKIGIDKLDPNDQPEDGIICTKYRKELEAKGINFAPLNVAEKFSYQAGEYKENIFGFHSPDNFPKFFPEPELIRVADEIVERIFQPIMMLRYLQASIQLNYHQLFRETVQNFYMKPNLLKAIEFELKHNPSSDLPNLIQKINSESNF